MVDTRTDELKRAETWWATALADATERFVTTFEHSPAAGAAAVRCPIVHAACVAINEDVDEESFIECARAAYRYAHTLTREVEAEDDN